MRQGRMERLQKVLAHAGVASRRRAEELILAGRVQVNGQVVTELGMKVDAERDAIAVDGGAIRPPAARTYILLHKPRGVLSTTDDPRGRPTILDLVETRARVYPVGRLDKDSEGLILLTDDGALAHQLTHPRYEHEREYRVLVRGRPDSVALRRLREGVELEDGMTWPAVVRPEVAEAGGGEENATWLRMVIHEGRKRQVRRMCQAVGHPVQRLIRVRMGSLELGELPSGVWRYLVDEEIRALTGGESGVAERPCTIAIDGPSASGKSTVGELLAKRLGYLYFDTGAMYRAVTWMALKRQIDVHDEPAVVALAHRLKIDVVQPTVDDGRQYTVWADGEDITWDIRRPEVATQVSVVSAYPGVRRSLTPQQREVGRRGQVVMVGRDVGTVVLPDADLKIFLDASLEERARRRYREMVARGEEADYAEVLSGMRRRDEIDSQRQMAPLRPAEDAVIIDTTHLGIDEVVQRVEARMARNV
jgi:cytidylate kinase